MAAARRHTAEATHHVCTLAARTLFCLAAYSMCHGTAALAAEKKANAGDYPARPVRVVVPFPPGGIDTVARAVGHKLTETTGRQFVIDNRPGAGGTIGTAVVANAANDGYTTLFTSSAFAISVAIYRKLPYDSVRDFAPVASIASAPLLLVVHPSVPASNVKELIALAKAKPNALNYASNGSGSITFLAAELLKSMAGVHITEVAYKGAGPSLTALLSGEVQLMVAPLGPSLPHVRTGKLKALGVPSAQRSALFPELPTIAESGLPGYEALNWYGVLVPRGTSQRIVSVLNQHIVGALESSDVRARFAALGYDPTPSTPEQFGKQVREEINKWTQVIKDAGVPQS
ncbi:MAG: tripartite tricarboxylate transporter substrate binding protein [Betaproteobacteria bacterium]|nr:tripartite tricarboxylate transporter substrate binding protein [Betaproteobacteria bacterium]